MSTGGPSCRRYLGARIFDRVCAGNGIEHKRGKPCHPWTNGQTERRERTVKDATFNTSPYRSLEGPKADVIASVSARDLAKHLEAPGWKTHFDAVCHAGAVTPGIFQLIPVTTPWDQTTSQMQARLSAS